MKTLIFLLIIILLIFAIVGFVMMVFGNTTGTILLAFSILILLSLIIFWRKENIASIKENEHSALAHSNYFLYTKLVGIQYYDANHPEVQKMLKSSYIVENLQLEKEPNNPYDSYAIKVYWENYLLGYISSNDSLAVSKYLDEYTSYVAFIESYNPKEDPYYQIDLQIEFKA